MAELIMPPLLPGIWLALLQSHSGLFLGKSRHSGLFTTPDARIYVIAARYIKSTLPMPRSLSTDRPLQLNVTLDPIPRISWEGWSQHKYFFKFFATFSELVKAGVIMFSVSAIPMDLC